MTRTRRTAAACVISGLYLIMLPFALSLFSRTSDAEKLNDFYRPLMSDAGIRQFGTNLKIVNDAAAELPAVVLPTLERELGLDESRLNTFIGQDYPHVAGFLVGTPKLLPLLNPATEAVLAQRDNFRDADQFPFRNMPMNLAPYGVLAAGIALTGAGLGLFRRGGRGSSLSVIAVGAALVLGPLALGWFHQTAAAEKVAEAARAPFSPEVANTVVDNIYGIDAAFVEMRQAMFPAIAQRLGLSATQMDAYVHASFPATMRLLDGWDQQLHTAARDLSSSQIRYMDEFHNADATPYRALPWLVMAPGAILIAGAGIGLRRRRDDADDDLTRDDQAGIEGSAGVGPKPSRSSSMASA